MKFDHIYLCNSVYALFRCVLKSVPNVSRCKSPTKNPICRLDQNNNNRCRNSKLSPIIVNIIQIDHLSNTKLICKEQLANSTESLAYKLPSKVYSLCSKFSIQATEIIRQIRSYKKNLMPITSIEIFRFKPIRTI